MENIKLDLAYSNINQDDIMKYANKVTQIHEE